MAASAQSQTSVSADAVDPLFANATLPYCQVFYPYGFPVRVRSNDPQIIAAAGESWRGFSKRFLSVALEIRVIVSDALSEQRIVPSYRAQANLLSVISDLQNFGACDLIGGFAFLHLSASVAADHDFLRYQFLDGIVYTLLNAQHLLTVHAACVGKRGRGLLLLGESGAGKSSLAYACARRGWTYVADDASSLLLEDRKLTALGNPRSIRFRPSAIALFPELSGPIKLRNGKPTIELRTSQFEGFSSDDTYEIRQLVFLDRDPSVGQNAVLRSVSKEECRSCIYTLPLPRELAITQQREAKIDRLADMPACRLTYSDFDTAIDLLERTVDVPAGE